MGEVVERITRKNLNLESDLPLTISAQNGLIAQTEFFDKRIASRDMSNYYLIYKGEFAYNKSYSNGYPWGVIKRLDNYPKGVLSILYIVFKPQNVISQFLVSYFDTTYWHSQISDIAVEGARNHGLLNIPVHDFFKITISLPKSKEEQTQIGNFFKQLDETIALHKRKVPRFITLKQAFLNAIFCSKNIQINNQNPFSWEQRKLGEISNLYQPETISANELKDSGYVVYGANGIIGYYNKFNHIEPQVMITCRGSTCGTVNMSTPYSWITGNAMVVEVSSSGIDKIFAFYKLQSADLTSCITGSGQPQIVRKPLENFVIHIPKKLEEQTQIGNFFKQLDETIALHKRNTVNIWCKNERLF